MFIESVQDKLPAAILDEEEEDDNSLDQLNATVERLRVEYNKLQGEIDKRYEACFSGVVGTIEEDGDTRTVTFSQLSEEVFAALGRTDPKGLNAVLAAKESQDSQGWQAFQADIHTLKLQRSRVGQELSDVERALVAAERESMRKARLAEGGQGEEEVRGIPAGEVINIVLMTGFESFNVDLYQRAAKEISGQAPFIRVQVFSDRDVSTQRAKIEAALSRADVFFGSLLFDFDLVEWLRKAIERVPVRLVFESSLELMGMTQIGTFQMDASGERKGPPPAVKKVLSLFGSQREEDKMVGYLSFLKIGPQLLRFIPGKKARDLKNWLTIYGYWNQGGLDNVVSMFVYLVDQYFKTTGIRAAPPVETPATGCLHPDAPGVYFKSPAEYMKWYERSGRLRGSGAPVVAVLLYRKHVITNQPYIPQMIRKMEEDGLIPVPVFINGVEAHTIVRDQLTSSYEQAAISGGSSAGSLRPDAVQVDCVVSSIGFPLVGGPAGSMEGGRQVEVAKSILGSKNVPYVVAAPLLIQDLDSWSRDGVAGLQSVVLYSLPELDGAIDTVPLGGLVGNDIYLIPERVGRLTSRIKKWVSLKKTPAAERKLAILLYGFPPGVGATGTAALLNVPKSLENLIVTLRNEGYNVGGAQGDLEGLGEALVTALKSLEDQRVVSRGKEGVLKQGPGPTKEYGVVASGAEVTAQQLKEWLTYPLDWGPDEWGPVPYLPDPDVLVKKMEKQWGELRLYRGLMTTAKGSFLVPGLQLGNVWIGVQPLLGVEGDPMRLLFERDLTPHPQYAAFYKWLQHDYQADAVLHFGMHGTVEWLPGAPLGNNGLSWSDVLLGNLPNVYIYACNNPSESIIAKRRGYGTIISHNVPPYGRAGLYKQLASLKDLIAEYRENPENSHALRGPIIESLNLTGLQEDCPYMPSGDGEARMLTVQDVDQLEQEEFDQYASRLYQYLQVVENRLFSEGLHVLGNAPSSGQMFQYLQAYFGDDLPEEAVQVVAETPLGDLNEVRTQLERLYRQGDVESGRLQEAKVQEALRIRDLLALNTEELKGVMRALNGEYILPEAGGDLLRDGAGVLPTGRNIHALDPYRMPSQAAMERGSQAAEAILSAHRAANNGDYPETVAVNLWGLDAIKTKGESVAMALYLVGARPVKEGTGRIARFELIPLEELGRPRVDVLCNMSGIFRDSFQNVVELLDDLFQRAAKAEEPEAMNFIRKHVQDMEKTAISNPAARLFSNPAGDYGSMVNERVGTSAWTSGDELGDTWASRNAFSYGRGQERGTARPEVLQNLLKTTDRVVQEIDSVEYGLTDIQEYYANTGALKRAAMVARGGKPVGCSIVETFGKQVQPKELEEVLRLEYRSKLLNPRWAMAMADQGSGGAYEISQRMTAMVGWGATVNFAEDWVWDQAADTYVMDEAMAEKLRKNNPQAFSNVVRRMIEAAGRGMWKANPETLAKLQELYRDLDDELEGVVKK